MIPRPGAAAAAGGAATGGGGAAAGGDCSGDALAGDWTRRRRLWQSRLLVLAAPLLAGARQLVRHGGFRSDFEGAPATAWVCGLVCTVAAASLKRQLAAAPALPLAGPKGPARCRPAGGPGSRWLACGAWIVALFLPCDVLLAYGVFVAFGLAQAPFTKAWWANFLLAVLVHNGPLFRGIVACNAATVAIGWYGAQILLPGAFRALVDVWVVVPLTRVAPCGISSMVSQMQDTAAFLVVARCGDMFVHFIPTLTAVYMFASHITLTAALASLPCSLMYLAATGSASLADTNRIYGVRPEPPRYIWQFIYGSHVAFCIGLCVACALSGDRA